MNNPPNETARSYLGLATPPSSPTKPDPTWYSQEERLTLQIPSSPRKSRSCFLPRLNHPLTPPASPSRSDCTSPTYHLTSSSSLFLSPEKIANSGESERQSSLSRIPRPVIRKAASSNSPSCLDGTAEVHSVRRDSDTGRRHSTTEIAASLQNLSQTESFPSLCENQAQDTTEPYSSKHNQKSSVDVPSSAIELPSTGRPETSGPQTRRIAPGTQTASQTNSDSPFFLSGEQNQNCLSKLPVRHASSPLRPGQWVARGGMLTTPQSASRTPDRFIPWRRPPNTTRESFEINKSTDRLTVGERITRDAVSSPDPFSRQLRRSGRLNDELRTLREHSGIANRSTMNRQAGDLRIRRTSSPDIPRRVSTGAVWNVGGSSAVSDTVFGVSNGRGGLLGSGTNAPLYTSMFLSRSDPEAELETYERRLALAFNIDQSTRVLGETSPPHTPSSPTSSQGGTDRDGRSNSCAGHVWRDNAWMKDGSPTLLDAPQLRDDFYCTLLAYSHTAKCLAVGLGNYVHLWSETKGVDTPETLNALPASASHDAIQHVTSLAFSSAQGGQAILAVGRADGRVALWSPFDPEPRFDATQPKPVSCVSFRPTVVKRPSLRDPAMMVNTEELLIGDEAGHIYFYSIEWPSENESALFGWHGAMTLMARIAMHTQQICGLSWSSDGEIFATGGNDNICFLFETKKILQRQILAENSTAFDVRSGPNGESTWTVVPGRGTVLSIEPGREKHKWELNAAVKAIAFCPWQRGLLAIGGGSNDRCIHFYHTVSGACLATIDCAAQVTSLVWSTTRREIAATFGFAQPEHPFRIAVFSWPNCEQVVAIPWYDENRALSAISYPGGPNMGRGKGEDGVWWSRTGEEGCIVVAASDAAIRFHEIWSEEKKATGGGSGLLGGSDILESLHGIDKEEKLTIR